MATIQITRENFEEKLITPGGTAILDFYADWCGPCKMLAPVLEEIAKERPEVTIAKINIDEQPELAQAFQVMAVPTLMLMQDGMVGHRSVGMCSKSELLTRLGL